MNFVLKKFTKKFQKKKNVGFNKKNVSRLFAYFKHIFQECVTQIVTQLLFKHFRCASRLPLVSPINPRKCDITQKKHSLNLIKRLFLTSVNNANYYLSDCFGSMVVLLLKTIGILRHAVFHLAQKGQSTFISAHLPSLDNVCVLVDWN